MRYAKAIALVLAAAAAVVFLAAHLVMAQTYVLNVDPANSPPAFATIQAAIDAALVQYRGFHTDIYVVAGTYTETLSIPADADIALIALTRGEPWNTVIDGSPGSSAAVTVDALEPRMSPGLPTDRLTIEGFEISGGLNGVLFTGVPADSGGTDFLTTVSGCYIRKNAVVVDAITDDEEGCGAFIEGNATPLFINCSIVENEADGVRVSDDGDNATGAFADLLFCTVAMNGDHGVYVEAPLAGHPVNNARVRDTIIYRNGDGWDTDLTHAPDNPLQMEGGLVWQQNLFIQPEFGDYDAYTAVVISGSGFRPPVTAPADVYFGPPTYDGDGDGIIDTLWRNVNAGDDSDTVLNGDAPPSYLGAPGPVDVYIVRPSDGFTFIIEDGFTYTEDSVAGARTPYVTQVIPEWGTVANPINFIPDSDEGNWIDVYGARFEQDCDVIFDFDGDFGVVGSGERAPWDEYSPRVIWQSSGKLHVKVPQHPNTYVPPAAFALPHRVLVYVYNRESAQYSPTGADYEFRAADNQPFIVEISPNYYRDLGGSEGSEGEVEPEGLLASVLGWNFMPGAVVKIGGILCPYKQLIPRTTGATFPPLDEIEGVRVPVSEFGAGGSYDVEVINPNGLHAKLLNGFTYYADGVPREDPSVWKWRPGNFTQYAAAAAVYASYSVYGAHSIYRTFLGSGFDTGLEISFTDPPATTTETIVPANAALGILPDEEIEQHAGHTQRKVNFLIPSQPDVLSATYPFYFNTPFAAGTYEVEVSITNLTDMNGDPSTSVGTVASDFHWTRETASVPAGEGLFFDIVSPETLEIFRDPSWANPDWLRMSVQNWRNAMDVYVGDELVTTYSGYPYTEPAIAAAAAIYFEVPVQEEGVYGPLDITVTLPDTSSDNNFGELLYTMATSAYSYRNLYGKPYARAVVPKIVPVDTVSPPAPPPENITIYVPGSHYLGPATAHGIYTRLWLDWDVAGTNSLIDGDEILVTNITNPAIAHYEVSSFDMIRFSLDLTSYAAATYLRNTPVDVVVEQFDATVATGPAILTDSVGSPLRTRLEDAITFSSTAPPRIDRVLRLAAPFDISLVPPYPPIDAPPRRDGPVGGGTQLYIIGANFSIAGAGALDALVRIAGSEAKLLDIQPASAGHDVDGDTVADEFIVVETPPAPQGLPGTYDVTVISRPASGVLLPGVAQEDQWFTYFMDGAPMVTDISPDHRSDADTETMVATIYGYNFDDVVWVTFTDRDPETGTVRSQVRDQYYSLSPTEIVVEAPFALDYSSGPVYDDDNPPVYTDPDIARADIEVTVQNKGLDATYNDYDDAVTAGLMSEAVLFYYYNDGRDDVDPAVPVLAFNDVYLNYNDYVNADPGTGSISVDPMLDPGTSAPYPVGPYKALAPRVPTPWWLGKLAAISSIYGAYTGYWNPVAEKAFMIEIPPFTDGLIDFDLERDTRPVTAGIAQPTGRFGGDKPDIGADELSAEGDLSATQLEWYFASISPSPVGLLLADELAVLASIRGEMVSDAVDPTFFMLPQGVEPPSASLSEAAFQTWLDENSIRLDIVGTTANAPDDITYDLTNPNAIETLIYDAAAPAGLSDGDIIADGHAAVFFWLDLSNDGLVDPLEIIGWNRNIPEDLTGGSNTDGDPFITDDAIEGRHTVIDTIPPRIFIESSTYGGDDVVNGPTLLTDVITATDLIDPGHNDTYDALDVLTAQALLGLPVPNATPAALPRGDLWDPENVAAPVDYLGQIVYPAAGDIGAQIFFNVGSMVGLVAPEDLDITVNVEFVDVPVEEDPTAPDIFIDGPGADYVLSDRNRQLTGFFFDPLALPTSLDTGPARWRIGLGGHLMTHPYVQTQTTLAHLAGSANEGFFINDIGAPVAEWQLYDHDPDDMIYGEQLDAEWTFEQPVPAPGVPIPGIKWQLARDNLFRVATQFVGVDAAANQTGDDDITNILDPLHIWWLINVQTQILNNSEGRTLRSPTIDWELNRSTDVNLTPPDDLTAGPRVINTFRIWSAENYDDVYAPPIGALGDWQPWSRRPIPTDAGPFGDLYPTLDVAALGAPLDQWLLIVVLSADEAGNVEPWPTELNNLGVGTPGDPTDDLVEVLSANGVNWMRFYNGGQGLPDTQIEAEFWYDDATDGARAADAEYLGAVHRIPLHADPLVFIEGGFTLVVDPGTADSGDILVDWTLIEDGADLELPLPHPAVSPWTPRRNQVVLPSGTTAVGSFRAQVVGGVPPDQPRNYTFRAMAFVDDNPTNGDYDAGEVADPTPATYSFTVLPAVPVFERVETDDAQPIKIQEEQ